MLVIVVLLMQISAGLKVKTNVAVIILMMVRIIFAMGMEYALKEIIMLILILMT